MGGAKFGGSPGRCPVSLFPTFHLVLVKKTEEQIEGTVTPDSWEDTWV